MEDAIISAAQRMGKDLDKSRNFGPEWDLPRFVLALELIKDKKKKKLGPLPADPGGIEQMADGAEWIFPHGVFGRGRRGERGG